MAVCFSCKGQLSSDVKPSRSDVCPSCGSDIRVCRNCGFFDAKAYNGCREPAAERVLHKEKANFCDYFRPGGADDSSEGGDAKAGAKDALDRLFGGH